MKTVIFILALISTLFGQYQRENNRPYQHQRTAVANERFPLYRFKNQGIYPSIAVPIIIGTGRTLATGVDLGAYFVWDVGRREGEPYPYYKNKQRIALRPNILYNHYWFLSNESISNNILGGGLELFREIKSLTWLSASGNIITAKGAKRPGYQISTGIAHSFPCASIVIFYMSIDDLKQVGFSIRWDPALFVYAWF